MELTDAELKQIINAVQKTTRRLAPYWISVDDLKQVAHLAIIKAQRPEILNKEHLWRWTYVRARGAMIDLIRTSHRDLPVGDGKEFDEDMHALASDDIERVAQIRQALNYVERRATPRCKEALGHLAYMDQRATAKVMGITESRVSQLLTEARKLLTVCL